MGIKYIVLDFLDSFVAVLFLQVRSDINKSLWLTPVCQLLSWKGNDFCNPLHKQGKMTKISGGLIFKL